jgi:hypothetical protein
MHSSRLLQRLIIILGLTAIIPIAIFAVSQLNPGPVYATAAERTVDAPAAVVDEASYELVFEQLANVIQMTPVISTNQLCLPENYTGGGSIGLNSCTANDIDIANATVTIIDGCDGSVGDTATIQLFGDIVLNAQTRYDIGFWISLDGADPRLPNGTCNVVELPEAPDPPFYSAPGERPGDTCGDLDSVHSPIIGTDLGTHVVSCDDPDMDGLLDLPICTTWEQQDDGPPQNPPSCTNPLETAPGTTSKCNCDSVQLEVPVPVTSEITKTANPVAIGLGVGNGLVTFTVDFAASDPVTITSITDVPFGDVTTIAGYIVATTCAIPANPVTALNCTFTVDMDLYVNEQGDGDPGSYTDVVTVGYTDGNGRNGSPSDDATVVVSDPLAVQLQGGVVESIAPGETTTVVLTVLLSLLSIAAIMGASALRAHRIAPTERQSPFKGA